MDVRCKLTNNTVNGIDIGLTSVKVHREKNVTFWNNFCRCINLICKLQCIDTGSNGKRAVEYNRVSTINRHLIRYQETMWVITNNCSSLVVNTTRSDSINLNQFLNVV